MVQQVLLRNKILITALSFSFISCGHNKIVVPAIFFNATEHHFITEQGITYLNQKPFSGFQFALYGNGDTAFIIPYYEGKENGISRSWYENKKQKEIRVFEEGKKTGV